MKKVWKILFFALLLTLVGCSENQKLRHKEARAEHELELLQEAILSGNVDSVWLVGQLSSDIHYLVFRAGRVIFWSDNSLTTPTIFIPKYDVWYNDQFTNAMCRCMWKKVEDYQIQVVIPMEWKLSDGAKREIANSFSYKPLLTDEDRKGEVISVDTRVRIYFILTIFVFLPFRGGTLQVGTIVAVCPTFHRAAHQGRSVEQYG